MALVAASLIVDLNTAFAYRRATRELIGLSSKTDLQLLGKCFTSQGIEPLGVAVHSIAVTVALAVKTLMQIVIFAGGEDTPDTMILIMLLLSDIRMAIGSVFLFVVR